LGSLLRRAFHKAAQSIDRRRAAVIARQLAIDKNSAARLFAADAQRVSGNKAFGDSADGVELVLRQVLQAALARRRRRIDFSGFPGLTALNGFSFCDGQRRRHAQGSHGGEKLSAFHIFPANKLITLTALIYLTERKPCQIDYFGHSYLLRAFYLATASLFLL